MTKIIDEKISLYVITAEDRAEPTLIVASTEEHARAVFFEFMTVHAPFHDPAILKVQTPGAPWLANRPQLAAAVAEARDRSEVGVARWLGHRAGWEVRPARSVPVGCLSAHEPEVHYFRFDHEDGLDLAVFAYDVSEAIRLFEIWHKYRFETYREDFNVQRMSPWLLVDERLSLREDAAIGLVGVGARCDDGNWRIVKPDDFELA